MTATTAPAPPSGAPAAPPARRMARARGRGDRGQLGGVEVLPFGFLIFVAFTLLIASMWAVIDTKFAADAAAREAVRLVVESTSSDVTDREVRVAATAAATATLAEHGRPAPATVTVGVAAPDGTGRLLRCSRVEVTVRTSVPALRIPFLGGYGPGVTIEATHAELVDPHRSDVAGVASCAG